MATYVIGDLQGCFKPLIQLLEHISFNPEQDTLWFTGDLVNRGPQSLECLRYVKNLGPKHRIVLGNHDLHLLAIAHQAHPGWPEDTLQEILSAPDREELLTWLIQQPLLHHQGEYTMVHAGLAKDWDLNKAQSLAKEVELVLKSDKATDFFNHMYGNEPNAWQDDLTSYDRLRCIVNYFTRARFCRSDGSLELKNKGPLAVNNQLIPWFKIPDRKNKNIKILFGHWAALGGVTDTPNVYALDTGCIWGFALTAMRLSDESRFSISC